MKLSKIHRKVPVLEYHLNVVAEGFNFIKKTRYRWFSVITLHTFKLVSHVIIIKIVKESYFRTACLKLLRQYLTRKIWSFWCICTYSVNTCFEIPNIFRAFDKTLTHFRFFLKTTPVAPETTCTKLCKLSLTSYVCFSQHKRAIQIIIDCELHKLIL